MASVVATLEDPDLHDHIEEPTARDPSRRRFTIAVVVGIALVTVPYLFVLWDLWTGSVNLLRTISPNNFYEIQARALIHGRLWVPNGSLGIEGFLRDGHTYAYFGLFPSLLRLPFMALFPHYDNHFTGPSLLLAWVITGVFSSLLLWRVRILIRGQAIMGWAEAGSFGVLTAAIMGGSVLMFLAANPWVYDEDLAWSVALTVGSIFALLGVMERPTWRRVTLSGVLILAANLNRLTTGWACVIAAVLVAAWFAFGRGGTSNRRWTWPVLAAGLVPLAISCLVSWVKFDLPFGLPMADQVWTQVNAHRRYFLAANGGKAFSFSFLPSTLWAYMKPAGLTFSSLFPFITLPTAPAQAVGGAVLDQTYATASLPVSMPLLFLLSCWGLVTAFRPRPIGQMRMTRVLLVAAAAATAGVLLWGYIAERYLADFLPLLVLASAIGLVDLWRRLNGRGRRARTLTVATVALVGIFSVAANVGAAIGPSNQWTPAQTARFVTVQKSASFGSLAKGVAHGSALPYWAPAGQLYAVGACSGLYLSSGVSFKTSPGQQLMHATWNPVEQGPGINHAIAITINRSLSQPGATIPILRFGRTTLLLETVSFQKIRFKLQNPSAPSVLWPPAGTGSLVVLPHRTYDAFLMTDPNLHEIEVFWNGRSITKRGSPVMTHYLAGSGPAVLKTTQAHPGGSIPALSVVGLSNPQPNVTLCRSFVSG